MPHTRIEIEDASGRWVGQLEMPTSTGMGLRKHRVVAASFDAIMEQVRDLYQAAASVPKDEGRMGEMALELRSLIGQQNAQGETVTEITLTQEQFEEFISSGAGLDLWERRTPGKPLIFEGAVFAVPVIPPYEGEKFSWRPIAPSEQLSEEVVAAVAEAVPVDPSAPVHQGRPTAAGFWRKCRCAECESARDAANGVKASAAAA